MKPTIKFLGVGGAFAPISKGNSNMLITCNGKHLLVDCGGSVQYTLKDEFGVDPRDIDALWISHLHADHIGSMEWFAFYRHFLPKKDEANNVIKPKLFMVDTLMSALWETSLKGGLQAVESRAMHLTNYFDCAPMKSNDDTFIWENFIFAPIKTIHSRAGMDFVESYGLFLSNTKTGKTTFITTDTQFTPSKFMVYYEAADQIFHDTETLKTKSHVHAHYDDLVTLPDKIKSKVWMYHYAEKISTWKEDGFRGFVDKGQEFEL